MKQQYYQHTSTLPCGTETVRNNLAEILQNQQPKIRIQEFHGLVLLTLLLGAINRNQWCSLVWDWLLDCVLNCWCLCSCTVLIGNVVGTVFIWHYFKSANYVRQFFPLILVYFVVVVHRRFTCMACYFTNNVARLTRLFQFGHQRFSHAVVGQFFVRLKTGGHGFHDVADGIFAHSNFGVPDII